MGIVKVTRCPACGSEMGIGDRVCVTLGWEYRTQVSGSGGAIHDVVTEKFKSGKVCRSCGMEVALLCGIAIPDEVSS